MGFRHLVKPNFKHIKPLPVMKYSGFMPGYSKICVAKRHRYSIIKNVAVTGDAPKDVIRLYEFGSTFKNRFKSWPIYIAKLGHKWYPNESITEQLLTDIGKAFGFEMAQTKLCLIGGQIRLLSKYFLLPDEKLEHGAEIYAAFLEDKQFVEEVEKKKLTQDFFTVSFTKKVLEERYQDFSAGIYRKFMHTLFFDSLVGNNDRHMYNWAIITNVNNDHSPPRYSPIYDSARALMWNKDEPYLLRVLKSNSFKDVIEKYCEKSRPKIGIENPGMENINHFDLVRRYKKFYLNDSDIIGIFEKEKIGKVFETLDNAYYKSLFTPTRRNFIREILRYRYEKIKKILAS